MKGKIFKRSIALALVTLTLGSSLNSITYAEVEGEVLQQPQEDLIPQIPQWINLADSKIEELSAEIKSIENSKEQLIKKSDSLSAYVILVVRKLYDTQLNSKNESLMYWEKRKMELEKCLKQSQVIQEKEERLKRVKQEKSLQAKEALEKNSELKKPESETRRTKRIRQLKDDIALSRDRLNVLEQQVNSRMDEEERKEKLFIDREKINGVEIGYYNALRTFVIDYWIPQVEEIIHKMIVCRCDWYKLCILRQDFLLKLSPDGFERLKPIYISTINSMPKEKFHAIMKELVDQVNKMRHPMLLEDKRLKEKLDTILEFSNEIFNEVNIGFDNSMDAYDICLRGYNLVYNIRLFRNKLYMLKNMLCGSAG